MTNIVGRLLLVASTIFLLHLCSAIFAGQHHNAKKITAKRVAACGVSMSALSNYRQITVRTTTKLLLCIPAFLAVLLYQPDKLFAGWHAGGGAGYALPLGDAADNTNAAIGAHAIFESRHFCPLWFGLRLDWYAFDRTAELEGFLRPYYEDAFYFSPAVRYNFVGDNCYELNWSPYIQAMITLSAMENNDELNRLGVGGAIGLGIAKTFTLFDKCWSIDAHGHYSGPNFIVAADGRQKLSSLNAGLTISVSP